MRVCGLCSKPRHARGVCEQCYKKGLGGARELRQWTSGELQRVREMIAEGHTLKQIAAELHLPLGALRSAVKRHGIRRFRRVSKARFLRVYRDWRPDALIAKLLDCSERTAQRLRLLYVGKRNPQNRYKPAAYGGTTSWNQRRRLHQRYVLEHNAKLQE